MTTHEHSTSTSSSLPACPAAPDGTRHRAGGSGAEACAAEGADGGGAIADHRLVESDTDVVDDANRGTWATGNHGELLAAEHLASMGMEVVARNWRISQSDLRGELDLVALDHVNGVVVIVEVKTRRGEGFGGPLGAVDRRKRAQLRRLAMAFLTQARLPYHEVRFDVVGVRLDTRHLNHVVDAL